MHALPGLLREGNDLLGHWIALKTDGEVVRRATASRRDPDPADFREP
jgi:hypothetical protein